MKNKSAALWVADVRMPSMDTWENRRAVRCAHAECPDYQWNMGGVPQSIYCWAHAKARGEVTHG